MSGSSEAFILLSKGRQLGRVVFERENWPWNFGTFEPSAEFSQYASIFMEAERLRNLGDSEREERDSRLRQIIDLELQFVREDSGELAGEPDLLWISGNQISWRGHSGGLRNI
jgi:hypothetical protein